jgi:long-chain fatty acid transport protein
MNTNYDAPVFGVKPAGVNLSQMFIAPTLAFTVHEHHALGVTVLAGYQLFKAEGLQAFGMFSGDPQHLTNNSTASAFGTGVRVGYLGRVSERLSIGASYQSRMSMGKFDKYKGLFAEQGGFDIPSTWTIGVALHPNARTDFAVDVQRINYSEIPSIANPMLPNLMMAPLGTAAGPGFGWRDMTTLKLGWQYRATNSLTWRAGYSYGKQPVPSTDVLFNILAPGVIEQHATFGLSKQLGDRKSLDLSLTRAFSKSVSGPNLLEAPGRQTIDLRMDQWDIGVGFTVRFK